MGAQGGDENTQPIGSNDGASRRRYHQITKAGPPSREELEERKKKLAEWKRDRQLRKNPKLETACQEQKMVCINSELVKPKQENENVVVPKWGSSWLDGDYYLRIGGPDATLQPIPKPHFRLFSLDQVESAIERGLTELASAMLSVIGAPGQLPYNDARSRSKRFQRILRRLKGNCQGASEEELTAPDLNLPPSPIPDHLRPMEEEDDEVLSQLQEACEEVTRRQSAIFDPSLAGPRTPEFRSVQKAAQFILEEDLLGSGRKRLFSQADAASKTDCHKRAKSVTVIDDSEDELGGSKVKFAVMTPTKKIKEMLQTDLVISPVRRSTRNPPAAGLYDDPSEIPSEQDLGYLPNPSIEASSPCKRYPPHK